MKGQIQIEKKAYYDFMNLFRQGVFAGQRLGQAFYNHFKLHKLSDQKQLRNLYECDGKAAHKVIGEVFYFN